MLLWMVERLSASRVAEQPNVAIKKDTGRVLANLLRKMTNTRQQT